MYVIYKKVKPIGEQRNNRKKRTVKIESFRTYGEARARGQSPEFKEMMTKRFPNLSASNACRHYIKRSGFSVGSGRDYEKRIRDRFDQYLYAISDGAYVKLGISKDPTKRMADLQVSQPRKLRLLGCYGTKDYPALTVERVLHSCLEHGKARGEWFKPKEINRVAPFIEKAIPIIEAELRSSKAVAGDRISKSRADSVTTSCKAKLGIKEKI